MVGYNFPRKKPEEEGPFFQFYFWIFLFDPDDDPYLTLDNNGSLHIQAFFPFQSGVYTCRVSNGYTSATSSAAMTVYGRLPHQVSVEQLPEIS